MHFEAQVQTSFVALMLTGGFAPCLSNWPIAKIKLQGRCAGYETDDLIIFTEKPDKSASRRILAQIKHSVKISGRNVAFKKVIQSAWNDFNNPKIFTRNADVFALITGPLSITDVNDTRTILEWARHFEDSEEYSKYIKLAKFSSKGKQAKLEAFRKALQHANGSEPITDEILYEFMKHFHLLGYDLDIKAGVIMALLHSLIGQFSQDSESILGIWTLIKEQAQWSNQNAGTITLKSLPEDLTNKFRQRVGRPMPAELLSNFEDAATTRWNQDILTTDLVVANLLGAWNEKSDQELISQLSGQNFDEWISKMRGLL